MGQKITVKTIDDRMITGELIEQKFDDDGQLIRTIKPDNLPNVTEPIVLPEKEIFLVVNN